MAIAAGAEAERLDLDVFMSQASEYNELGSGIEKLTRLLMNLNLTHPMPVKRIHELMTWVASGDYDRNRRRGSYVTRDEPVRPRAEASDAGRALRRALSQHVPRRRESIADAGKQLSDWLRALGDDD